MYLSRAVPRQDVWGFFLGDADKKRDFLYRYDFKNGEPVIYIVSKYKPVSFHGVWSVESKEYSPRISNGDVLSFSVRMNPVVTRSFTDDKTGKSVHKRHDVVMDYKFKCREGGRTFSYDEALATVGTDWLVSRGEKYGFSVKEGSVCAESYERRVFDKSGEEDKKREAVIATLDLKGVLEVRDSEIFVDTLFNGIGPAKGFGCGLILVKRFG